jgi:transcriptional regulator with XRE-family HTH domain
MSADRPARPTVRDVRDDPSTAAGGGAPGDETLGAVLRSARAAADLSLREVERRTGLSNAHLSQIETDTIARPEMAILWELAAVYGLDFGRLLALAGHAGAGETSGRQRRRMSVALRAMTELSPGEQEEALRYMAELKARREEG